MGFEFGFMCAMVFPVIGFDNSAVGHSWLTGRALKVDSSLECLLQSEQNAAIHPLNFHLKLVVDS
jgi:hypothetical protein